MGSFGALAIILLAVVADYYWFNGDKKRWGWMKNWSKFSKGLFFTGFTIVSVLVYLVLSTEYL